MAGMIWTRWLDHITYIFLRRIYQSPQRILGGYLSPGMTVLDVGCGTGYFSLPMARMVGAKGRVVSVDLEAEEIRELNDRAAKAGLSERIDTRVCSDDSLGIDELASQIDFALAFYVAHHAADPHRLMTEIFNGLRPKGRFLLAEPKHHASAEVCSLVENTARQAGFTLGGRPKIARAWAVLFIKE
ncbi:MAG TPA: class I SAM-dependent methyltransferase [Acidobacteriota bacterium]|nr:class I SAM-dependent methyltransferase [Acidobacteriota bacterium]